MNKQINQSKKGFTLAELVAVVVIISILSGIALGAYRQSVERARFSEGLLGAHTFAAAVDVYYEERIPHVDPTALGNVSVRLANQYGGENGKVMTPYFA